MISMDSGESFPIMFPSKQSDHPHSPRMPRQRIPYVLMQYSKDPWIFFFPVALTTALGFACPQGQSVHSGLKMQSRMWLFLAAQIEKTG